jgi:hypothetical protein
MITERDIAEKVVCGPDPQRHIEAIKKYADAGYEHIWIHQIGPNQEEFLKFYEREIFPSLKVDNEKRDSATKSQTAGAHHKKSRSQSRRGAECSSIEQ